ncbi:MAG: hypothetical protein ABS34_05960 [Opitutaceae bacterium BACL24 MAG-120322-bin51]|nr:MAG: hypothetical protein ABS34_05960 [Opitutaceae bacterium BACL24 MAG-120322-bin51]
MQTEDTHPTSASLGDTDLSQNPDLNSRSLKFDCRIFEICNDPEVVLHDSAYLMLQARCSSSKGKLASY